MDFNHIPVLLNEVASFVPESPKILVDFTLGGAGHSSFMLSQNPELYLYGIDQDSEALASAEKNLEKYSGRFSLIQSSFSKAVLHLVDKGIQADFILADLGVSSHQINSQNRGFSFRNCGPLDMRMDLNNSTTAATIVNEFDEKELYLIIKKFGEETFAKKIAQSIVIQRKKKPLLTTDDLTHCIRSAIPKKFQYGRIHPATKTFQAIRIAVNSEIEELTTLLQNSIKLAKKGGRIAIISFHSLEDRPVKKMFHLWENPCECPTNIPYCICGKKAEVKSLSKKIIRASQEEIDRNSRSRSAKLRVVEKL